MNTRYRIGQLGRASAAGLAFLAVGATAWAQFPGPPQGGGPGGGRGPMGRPNAMGGPGMMGQRGPMGQPGGPMFGGPEAGPVTAAQVPLPVLDKALSLTDDEKTKITAVQQQLGQDLQAAWPKPGDGGGPPDASAMKAARDKRRDLEKQASDKVAAALTADQRTALAALLQDLTLFRLAGLPPDGELKLTDAQRQQIQAALQTPRQEMRRRVDEALGKDDFGAVGEAMGDFRRQAHDAAMAALTDAQKAQLQQRMASRQGPDGGGPGGLGGFGPGGPGMPPPPGGQGGGFGPPPPSGPDGPPPPDGAGGPPPPNGGDAPPANS